MTADVFVDISMFSFKDKRISTGDSSLSLKTPGRMEATIAFWPAFGKSLRVHCHSQPIIRTSEQNKDT